MKKKIFTKFLSLFVVSLCCHGVAQAQVENYCLRLTNGGSVNCGAMPELDGKSTYTIQFWIKPGTWKDNVKILSRGNSLTVKTIAEKTIEISSGSASLSVKNSGLTAGKWTQLTFLYGDGKMRILVNGRQAVSKSADFTIADDDSPFVIGDGFDGYLDELRVWSTEITANYDYYIHNTINKFVPQLGRLVAYYKFDQNLCPNIVDYKALFNKAAQNNHHGIITGNVTREVVTDNPGLPYLLCGAYTDNKRFFDCGLTRDQFLLSNDVIMLGIEYFADGHLDYVTPNDHATLVNADRLDEYQGRKGVLSLRGSSNSRLNCPQTVITESNNYTFETWIYLEEWTEGAFIVRRESSDKQKGFSISLGKEETREVIVRINGKKFVNTKSMPIGKWVHFALATNNGGTTQRVFRFVFNGTEKSIDTSVSDDGKSSAPSNMGNLQAYIGEGLNAKFDNTLFWKRSFTASELREHMEVIPFMPGLGKKVYIDNVHSATAYYTYDRAEKPGHDSFSQDEWRYIVESAYKGYRGYQIRIAVLGWYTSNWKEVIANADNRVKFAKDLARLSEGYSGVELDLEWMDGTQTNLGLLADEILKRLPKGKTLMISHHQYGAYQYPKEKINTIDGFTFQQYGPQKNWYSLQAFKDGYNAFKNYGYPDDKIYLSYSTTTSSGSDKDGKWASDVIGISWGLLNNSYVPATDGSAEVGQYNGNYYTFMGPYQVFKRAQFCAENNLQGIFYWDMGNDIKPSTASKNYSYAKYCNYGLASNVDTLVTEVEVKHVVTAIKQVNSDVAQELQILYNASDQTFSVNVEAKNEVAAIEIFTATGVRVRSEKAAQVSANSLPAGAYLVSVKLKNGQRVSRTIVKK